MIWNLLAISIFLFTACASKKEKSFADVSNMPNPSVEATKSKVSGLKIQTLQANPTGQVIRNGQRAKVHYTGWLTNGIKFDSSKDTGFPFEFTVGAGQVIRGWDMGVAGMKLGEKRKLTVPPHLAYGPKGIPGAIPPHSTLIFEVELLGIE